VQGAEQPGQIHFRVSGLEAELERGLESALAFGATRTLAKKIGVFAEVFKRGEGDCVHAVLDRSQSPAREFRYPTRKPFDAPAESRRRYGTVDPAVTLGELCVVVARTQHHLEGSRAAHQPNEMLDPTATRNDAKRRLGLGKNRGTARGKTQIARQYEF